MPSVVVSEVAGCGALPARSATVVPAASLVTTCQPAAPATWAFTAVRSVDSELRAEGLVLRQQLRLVANADTRAARGSAP